MCFIYLSNEQNMDETRSCAGVSRFISPCEVKHDSDCHFVLSMAYHKMKTRYTTTTILQLSTICLQYTVYHYSYLLTFWKSLEGDLPLSNYKQREILRIFFCSNIFFLKRGICWSRKRYFPTRHDFKIDKISLF